MLNTPGSTHRYSLSISTRVEYTRFSPTAIPQVFQHVMNWVPTYVENRELFCCVEFVVENALVSENRSFVPFSGKTSKLLI
jgi:hypothetical protein